MEVIIHLPRSKEGQEELAKCVATVHAQLIYNYISRLECSTEQKVALLDAIQENIHDEIKKEKEGWSLNLLHLDGFLDKVSATEDEDVYKRQAEYSTEQLRRLCRYLSMSLRQIGDALDLVRDEWKMCIRDSSL